MAQLSRVKALFDAGWIRWGWPESVGGIGGRLRSSHAVLGEEVTARGLVEPGFYSMTEVLAPTLAEFRVAGARPGGDPEAAQRGSDVVPRVLRARYRQ